MHGGAIQIDHGKVRFPAQTVSQREFAIDLPGIGAVKPDVLGTLCLFGHGAVSESRSTAEEQISHSQSSCLAIEGEIHMVVSRIRVGPPRCRVCAEGHLVVAAKNTDIIVGRKDCCSGGPALRPDAGAAGDAHAQGIRRVVESFDSQIIGAEPGIGDIVGKEFAGCNSIPRHAE